MLSRTSAAILSTLLMAAAGVSTAALSADSQTQGQTTKPVPRPMPLPGTSPPPSSSKPASPDATVTPQDGSAVDPKLAGIPIYPSAELLFSFDAGRNQFVFTFGTDMPYSDIVAYYKTQLRTSGTEVFRAPAIYQFDLGPFRAETMAYRPSVLVKDYSGPDSPGYLHVSGTAEKRYRTVVQIVPVSR